MNVKEARRAFDEYVDTIPEDQFNDEYDHLMNLDEQISEKELEGE